MTRIVALSTVISVVNPGFWHGVRGHVVNRQSVRSGEGVSYVGQWGRVPSQKYFKFFAGNRAF